MTETNTTTDSVTGLKNCKPVTLVETNVGSEVVIAKKGVNFTETLALTDSATAVSSRSKLPVETLSESDSVAVVANHVAAFTENLTTTATVLTNSAHAPNILDSLTTSDSCSISVCRPKSLVETNVGADAVTAAKSAKLVGLSETHSVSDSLATLRNVSVAPTENLVTSATAAAALAANRAVTESLTHSDQVSHTPQNSINLAEVVNVTDTLTSFLSHNVTENLTTTDSLLVRKCGAIQEFLTTAAALTVTRGVQVSISETQTTTPAVTGRISGRALTETLTTSASISAGKPGVVSVNLNESSSTVDAVATVRSLKVALSVSVSVSDSIATLRAVNAQITESLTTTDTLIVNANRMVFLTNTSVTADSLTTLHNFNRALTESLSTSAAVSTFHAAVAGITETHTTTASTATAAAHFALVVENLSTQAQIAAQSPHHTSIALIENLFPVDAVATAKLNNRNLAESSSTSAVATANPGRFVNLTENVSAVAVVSVTHSVSNVSSAILETVFTQDILTVLGPHSLSFTESFVVVDIVQATKNRRRFILTEETQ